jgi:exosortase/archaeosortase family protein
MNPNLKVGLRIALVIAANLVAFVVFQHDARVGETWLSTHLAGLVGPGRIHTVAFTTVLVQPAHHASFFVIVTPSCSSISSVCSLVCLASLLRSSRPRRVVVAFLAAALTIVLGNVIRIAASIAIGLSAGEVSLVLFHDWVGSTFAFAYTLFGFVMMLFMLLPRRRETTGGLSVG